MLNKSYKRCQERDVLNFNANVTSDKIITEFFL